MCPTCGHEWSPAEVAATAEEEATRDAIGNVLENRNSVIVIKDLMFNGGVIKGGTKVKNYASLSVIESSVDVPGNFLVF